MSNTNLGHDSKALVSSWLRSLEVRTAGGDENKLQEIAVMSDDETIRKWLWTATIYGAPATFIALPIFLGLLQIVFSGFIMGILWFFAKLAMAIVLLIFGAAIYFTFRKDKHESK
jgi:uncharacterized membrane protein